MAGPTHRPTFGLAGNLTFETMHLHTGSTRLFEWTLVLALSLPIGACGKGDPIQLTDSRYLGAWLHEENAFGNNIRVDNRLLAFYDDNTVSYFRCTKRGGSTTHISFPEAYISKLEAGELIVEADIFFTSAKLKFRVQRPPFERDGDWFMQMDGLEFRKMHTGEPSDHESWPCQSDSQD
jgi:hypothetical protein